MSIRSTGDVRFAVGYYQKGEKIDNASLGTKFKNWLATTSLGKNVFKMNPPKCLCVRNTKGQHVATKITDAKYGNFAKVDLSGTKPKNARTYTPPPSTTHLTLEERGSGPINVDKAQGQVTSRDELTTAKREIAEGFDKDFWNRDQMTVALYAKMNSRGEKGGPQMNAFVVQFDPEHPKGGELGTLLSGLKARMKDGSVKEGDRLQIAVQNGAHWTAVDAKIINGEPCFFVMDAAQQSTAHLTEAIRNEFPKATLFEFLDKKVDRLQFDDNSCSRFTLDHLSVMTRDTDMFERLLQNQDKFRKLQDGSMMVGIDHLSDGSLRMLQSHSNLDKLTDVAKSKLSSPTKGLDEYEQALSHTVVDFNKGKILNAGALAKKDSFAEKATDFLEGLSLENFNRMVQYRSGDGILF